jgi:hypothetical protein
VIYDFQGLTIYERGVENGECLRNRSPAAAERLSRGVGWAAVRTIQRAAHAGQVAKSMETDWWIAAVGATQT